MVEGWSVGPGRAAPPTGDVEFALADAPAGRLFALLTAAVLLAGAPTAALRLPPLAGGLLLLAGVAVGAGLARLATARTATLRVAPHAHVLSAPALRAPLVVPRAAVRAVVVDPVAARERRAGGANARVAARGAEHQASRTGDPEQPWWPVDLAPHLPLGDATVTGPAAVPNVAVVLHAPVALPTTWPAWLLSRLTGSLTEPVARPGTVVGGVLLRAADPLAVAAALGDAAPTGPLDSPTVAAFAPRRTAVRRRAITLGVAAAVVVGGVGVRGSTRCAAVARATPRRRSSRRGERSPVSERPQPWHGWTRCCRAPTASPSSRAPRRCSAD